MIFYASFYTEGLIRDAIASKIYLARMIDSLNTAVMNVSDEPDRKEDVLQAYKIFFEVLQKELEEWQIEKVQIGMRLDATGCEVTRTIEMTPTGFLAVSEGRREECSFEAVLEDMYPPEYVIGCVAGVMTRKHNKLLIDMLKSGVKYVSDLVDNEHKRRANSDSLSYTNGTDNNIIDADIRTTSSSECEMGSYIEERTTEQQSAQDI